MSMARFICGVLEASAHAVVQACICLICTGACLNSNDYIVLMAPLCSWLVCTGYSSLIIPRPGFYPDSIHVTSYWQPRLGW